MEHGRKQDPKFNLGLYRIFPRTLREKIFSEKNHFLKTISFDTEVFVCSI